MGFLSKASPVRHHGTRATRRQCPSWQSEEVGGEGRARCGPASGFPHLTPASPPPRGGEEIEIQRRFHPKKISPLRNAKATKRAAFIFVSSALSAVTLALAHVIGSMTCLR